LLSENKCEKPLNDDLKWVNGGEKKLTGKYFFQDCINTVRQQHPTANGATVEYPCAHNRRCDCYAGYKKEPLKAVDIIYRYRACPFDNE
jgi:hypothetical protein